MTMYCWIVSVETRRPDSIGKFSPIQVIATAANGARAFELASEACRAAGWETRGGDYGGDMWSGELKEGIVTAAIETPDPDAEWFKTGGIPR